MQDDCVRHQMEIREARPTRFFGTAKESRGSKPGRRENSVSPIHWLISQSDATKRRYVPGIDDMNLRFRGVLLSMVVSNIGRSKRDKELKNSFR